MKFTTRTKLQYKLTLLIHLFLCLTVVAAGIFIKISMHAQQFEPLLDLIK